MNHAPAGEMQQPMVCKSLGIVLSRKSDSYSSDYLVVLQ